MKILIKFFVAILIEKPITAGNDMLADSHALPF